MSQAREDLVAVAESYELPRVAELLRQFGSPSSLQPLSPPDPSLLAQPAMLPGDILNQMVRRGHHPQLLEALLEQLSDRPLEQALIAWDVLSSSILLDDGRLVPELRRFARPLAGEAVVVGQPGIDLNQRSALALVREHAERLAGDPLVRLAVTDTGGIPPLEALHQLHAEGHPMQSAEEIDLLHRTRQFAVRLGRAQLPTLAMVYLDLLARQWQLVDAALDLCELLLDLGRPALQPADLFEHADLLPEERQGIGDYLLGRGALGQRQLDVAASVVQRLRPDGPLSKRHRVLSTHLRVLDGTRPLDPSELDGLCDSDRRWRYAAGVRLLLHAQAESEARRVVPLLLDYIDRFGHDARTSYEALLVAPEGAPWMEDACRLFAQEARRFPYLQAAWRTLIPFLAEEDRIAWAMAELDARLVKQTTFAG